MSSSKCERCGIARRWLHRLYAPDGVELICANCYEEERGAPLGRSIRAAQRRKKREATVPAAELRRLYHDDRLSIREIAARLETAPSNVQFWMKDYGITRRGRGGRERVRPSREELVALLAKHRPVDIARMYGVSRTAVSKWAKLYGIPRPKDGPGSPPS